MSDRGYSIPLLLSRSGTIIHFAMERIFLTLLSKMFLDTTYTPTWINLYLMNIDQTGDYLMSKEKKKN